MLFSYFIKYGLSKAGMAKELGIHRSSVYRELARNQDTKLGYNILLVDNKAKARTRKQHPRKLDYHPALKQQVVVWLKLGWPPEQIASRLKEIGSAQTICAKTIYAYLYSPRGIAEDLYQYLPHEQPKRYPKIARKKRTPIPNRTCITERPSYINHRFDYGHWESDFMVFQKGNRTTLMTLRERKSRFLIALNLKACENTTKIK